MKYIITFILSLSFLTLSAQTFTGFRYQAIAKDATGAVIKSQEISIRFKIIDAQSTSVYAEIHDVLVGADGVFALTIGDGILEAGSINAVNWGQAGHSLEVELDPEGDGTYVMMGATPFTGVPYAAHALTVSDKDDADADPNNELQTLSFDVSTNTLSISNGNAITIPSGGTDADPANELQTITKIGSTVTLSKSGGSFIDATDDADADPNNEMQSLTFDSNTNTISISGKNSIIIPTGGTDADADPNNEIQTISKVGSTVSLSNNGGSFTDEVDDADANPSNEIQTISKNGNEVQLSINGGSFIDEVNDSDADPNNELQLLSFDLATNSIAISDGNSIAIPIGGTDADADPNNEIQELSRNENIIFLSKGGGTFTDQTEDGDADSNNEIQTLTKSGNEVTLSENGGSFTDEVNDADADATNEIQVLSRIGSSVTLSKNGGTFTDETEDADADPNNEIQSLSRNGSNILLSNGGGSFTDQTEDGDADSNNEIQSIIKSGNKVTLSENGGTFIDEVNDADADPTNEVQSLTFDSNTNLLSISGSNAVTIPTGGTDADADPTNEIQTISKSGNSIILSNGGGNVTDEINDADADAANELQDLDINLNNYPIIELGIENGGGVTFSVTDDDSNPINEIQSLSIENDSLKLSNANGISLQPFMSPWTKEFDGISYRQGITKVDNIEVDSSFRINNKVQQVYLDYEGLSLTDTAREEGSYHSPYLVDFISSSHIGEHLNNYTSVNSQGIVSLLMDTASFYGPNIAILDMFDLDFTIVDGGPTTQRSQYSGADLSIEVYDTGAFFFPLKSFTASADSLFLFDNQSFPASTRTTLTSETIRLKNNLNLTHIESGFIDFSSDAMPGNLTRGGISSFGINFLLKDAATIKNTSSFDHSKMSFLALDSDIPNAETSTWIDNQMMELSSRDLVSGDTLSSTNITKSAISIYQAGIGLLPPVNSALSANQLFFDDLAGQAYYGGFGIQLNNGPNTTNLSTFSLEFGNQNNPNINSTRMKIDQQSMTIRNDSGHKTAQINTESVGQNGKIELYGGAASEQSTVSIGAPLATGDGSVDVKSSGQTRLSLNAFGGSGFVGTIGPNGNSNVNISEDPSNQNWGNIKVFDDIGNTKVEAGISTNDGFVSTFGSNNLPNLLLGSNFNNPDMGGIHVFNSNADVAVKVQADDLFGFGEIRATGGFQVVDHNDDGMAGIVGSQIYTEDGSLSIDRNDINGFPQRKIYAHSDNGPGEMNIYGPNGDLNVGISGSQGGLNAYISLLDQNQSVAGSFTVDNIGQSRIEANFIVQTLSHPGKANKEIAYHGIVSDKSISSTQGTSKLKDGQTFVSLPAHYLAITNVSTMTVSLTPLSADTYGLAVIEKREDGFVVKELSNGKGNFKFDWDVKCVIKGHENIEVVREKRSIQTKDSQPQFDRSYGTHSQIKRDN